MKDPVCWTDGRLGLVRLDISDDDDFTSRGLRELAARLERVADELDEIAGTLDRMTNVRSDRHRPMSNDFYWSVWGPLWNKDIAIRLTESFQYTKEKLMARVHALQREILFGGET